MTSAHSPTYSPLWAAVCAPSGLGGGPAQTQEYKPARSYYGDAEGPLRGE